MTELLAPKRDKPGVAETEPPRPAGSPCSIRRVLVVVDEPCTASELCAGIRAYKGSEPIGALVIAPAHGSGRAQWYVDEDAARADAVHRLRACLACLRRDGIRVDGRLSGPDRCRRSPMACTSSRPMRCSSSPPHNAPRPGSAGT